MRPIPRNLISLAILAIVPACASFPPTLVEEGIVKINVAETRPVQVGTPHEKEREHGADTPKE